jgi:hypothetical protein
MLNGIIRRLFSSIVTGSKSQGSSTVGLRLDVRRYNPEIVVLLLAGSVLVVFPFQEIRFMDSMIAV